MKFQIDIEEKVTRINTYTIEVENDDECEYLLNMIGEEVENARHPDDIVAAIENSGYSVGEITCGAEDVTYKLW